MIRETAYRLLRHKVSGKTGLMVWHIQGMGIGGFIVLSYFLLFKSLFFWRGWNLHRLIKNSTLNPV